MNAVMVLQYGVLSLFCFLHPQAKDERMKRLLLLLVGLCAHFCAAAQPVLLISIDGLHPAYVTDAGRHGLAIPHLRSFVAEGTYASGVVGVVPTITYPSHTTIITGVAPARHGIVSNTTFDPLAKNAEGWFWYAEDLQTPTLWQSAAEAGLSTASINWPVTVGDPHIGFLIPEYWRAKNPEDLKLMRALSRPEGIMQSIERELGPFIDGYTDTLESDRVRTRFTLAILRKHKPDFTATHLIALDGTQHRDGPFVPSAYATLEALDRMIGELCAAALANDPAAVVVIVSDHGFIATHTAVNLAIPFVAADLIELVEPPAPHAAPAISSWDAQVWPAGGAAAIVLRDRDDRGVRERVAALLADLALDVGNGIARVVSGADLAALGGFPRADFVVEFAPGFYLGTALRGDLLARAASKGTHGYLPERPEMHAAFFIKGRGIARARDLGMIDMRAIAPTLAQLLDVPLPAAELAALPVRHSH
jgi:predicted AlkP superfamily pyrophosphatase or phosphodiesterase